MINAIEYRACNAWWSSGYLRFCTNFQIAWTSYDSDIGSFRLTTRT